MSDRTPESLREELESLRAESSRLARAMDDLEARLATAGAPPSQEVSRRRLLTGGALAAGVATASLPSVLGGSQRAYAIGNLPVTAPSHTRAGLPAIPSPGDIARVTDDVQGFWMADGTTADSWFSLLGEVVNVRDFGAKGDGITADHAAIQNAVNAARGMVLLPPGTYLCQAPITLKAGVTLQGAGYQSSFLQFTGAIPGLVFTPAGLTEARISLRDLTIRGVLGSTTDLVKFQRATILTLSNLNVRDTGGDCIKFEDCFEFSIRDCRIENANRKGVRIQSTTIGANVWTIDTCSFQANNQSGEATIHLEGAGWGAIRNSNLLGTNTVQNAIWMQGCACIEVVGNFIEHYVDSPIILATAASNHVRIVQNHIHSSSNTPRILVQSGSTLTNQGLEVIGNAFRGVDGSICFDPGATGTTFVYRFNDREFSGADVNGINESHVERFADPVRQKHAELLSEGALSGATPSVRNVGYAEVKNASPVTMTNLVGGSRDQLVILRFEDANTTIQHGGFFRLSGGTTFASRPLDMLTFLNVDGTTWFEVARSRNA